MIRSATRLIVIVAALAGSALGQSANPGTIVGAGYLFPPPIEIAPGQIITVFATGVGSTLKQPVFAAAGNLPTSLAGIGVTIGQETNIPALILKVSPATICPYCGVTTAITIQVPYELQQIPPLGGLSPFFNFFVTENGVPGAPRMFIPVPDQMHILAVCDTVIGGPGPSTGGCPREVAHKDGTLVSNTNPVSGGEELIAYATGLGVTNPTVPTGQSATQPTPTVQTFRVSFTFQADTPPSSPPSSASPPLYAGLTPGYPGLYQINFVVPSVPAGLPPCAGQGPGFVNTNLTVSIGGQSSFDGVNICVSLPH